MRVFPFPLIHSMIRIFSCVFCKKLQSKNQNFARISNSRSHVRSFVRSFVRYWILTPLFLLQANKALSHVTIPLI
uniref:Putative secreted protein n=1 Tax=Anopheles aquasalis TaxID=42839 RepID=T1DHV0_ANOAQ